jgi:hypothetical protein
MPPTRGASRMREIDSGFPCYVVLIRDAGQNRTEAASWGRVLYERSRCVHHCGLRAFSMPRVSISSPVGGMQI